MQFCCWSVWWCCFIWGGPVSLAAAHLKSVAILLPLFPSAGVADTNTIPGPICSHQLYVISNNLNYHWQQQRPSVQTSVILYFFNRRDAHQALGSVWPLSRFKRRYFSNSQGACFLIHLNLFIEKKLKLFFIYLNKDSFKSFTFILFLCVLSASMSGHHLYARYLDPSELELQMVVSIMRTTRRAASALTLCAISPATCTLLIN